MVDTCALMDIRTSQTWTAQDVITLCSSDSCLTDRNSLYCGNPRKWCPVFRLVAELPGY